MYLKDPVGMHKLKITICHLSGDFSKKKGEVVVILLPFLCFCYQWVVGFVAFLLPCCALEIRKLIKPLHVWMGAIILVLSIVSCISGINEKLFFSLKGNDNMTQPYAKLPSEALFANSLGVLIVLFGLVVLYILHNQSWRRPELGHDGEGYRPLSHEES